MFESGKVRRADAARCTLACLPTPHAQIVVTGAKSVTEATQAARKYVKIIKARPAPRRVLPATHGARLLTRASLETQFIMTKAGGGDGDVSVRFQGPTLQNMVGVADCKFPIRLEGLALSHMPHCSVRAAWDPRRRRCSLLTLPLPFVPAPCSRSPVRAGAVPGPHLPPALAQDGGHCVRVRQGRHHGRQGGWGQPEPTGAPALTPWARAVCARRRTRRARRT